MNQIDNRKLLLSNCILTSDVGFKSSQVHDCATCSIPKLDGFSFNVFVTASDHKAAQQELRNV